MQAQFSWPRESLVRLNCEDIWTWTSKLVKKNNLHLRHQARPYTHSTNFHHITRVAAWCLKSSKRTAICCSWTQNQLSTSLGIEPCRIERIESAGQPKLIPTWLFRKSILQHLGLVSVEQKLLRNSTLTSKQSWSPPLGSNLQIEELANRYHLIPSVCVYMYIYMNIYKHSWKDFSTKSTPDLAKVSYTALGLVNFYPFDPLVFTNTRLPWRTVQCLLLFHCDTSPSRKVL